MNRPILPGAVPLIFIMTCCLCCLRPGVAQESAARSSKYNQTAEFQSVRWSNGEWYFNDEKLYGASVQFVSNNNRPFVTTEISATGLTQPLILRFLDSDSGTVLDEMLIGPTQGEFVDRTIPLRARNLSLEIVSTSAPAIHGSVLINRVVGPPLPTSNGEPQGWTAGLTRIDLFENDDDQTEERGNSQQGSFNVFDPVAFPGEGCCRHCNDT